MPFNALLKILYYSLLESVIDFSRFSARCLVLVDTHSNLNKEVPGLELEIINYITLHGAGECTWMDI